mgnify:CR=1 FL=1
MDIDQCLWMYEDLAYIVHITLCILIVLSFMYISPTYKQPSIAWIICNKMTWKSIYELDILLSIVSCVLGGLKLSFLFLCVGFNVIVGLIYYAIYFWKSITLTLDFFLWSLDYSFQITIMINPIESSTVLNKCLNWQLLVIVYLESRFFTNYYVEFRRPLMREQREISFGKLVVIEVIWYLELLTKIGNFQSQSSCYVNLVIYS